LREWCYDAGEKKGMQRQELDVSACFAPLLAWVLQWWSPTQDKRLLLALDETPLGDRFHVLTISVLYRQCAIPVAWQVRGSRERGAWEPLWERLLSQLKPVVPQEWEVLVFADRGISGASLFRHIVSLQWHPFLRLTQRGSVRVQGREEYQPIKHLLSEQGVGWCGRVSCFASVQLRCTLLTGQGKGQKEPWVVITDLPAEQAQLAWYQMRYWIECGFKDLKSGGWKWQHSNTRAGASDATLSLGDGGEYLVGDESGPVCTGGLARYEGAGLAPDACGAKASDGTAGAQRIELLELRNVMGLTHGGAGTVADARTVCGF
jgi:hypothetical protein